MTLKLTEQQHHHVAERPGRPIEVVDPHSMRTYVLIPREQFNEVRSLLENVLQLSAPAPEGDDGMVVPLGIRLSQEAMRRDLPQLLLNKKLHDQWVAYHRDERIGIARTMRPLVEMCLQRGIPDDEYYVGVIRHQSLIEVEEMGPIPPFLMMDKEEEAKR